MVSVLITKLEFHIYHIYKIPQILNNFLNNFTYMQEKDNKENYFLEGFIIVMNQEAENS